MKYEDKCPVEAILEALEDCPDVSVWDVPFLILARQEELQQEPEHE